MWRTYRYDRIMVLIYKMNEDKAYANHKVHIYNPKNLNAGNTNYFKGIEEQKQAYKEARFTTFADNLDKINITESKNLT